MLVEGRNYRVKGIYSCYVLHEPLVWYKNGLTHFLELAGWKKKIVQVKICTKDPFLVFKYLKSKKESGSQEKKVINKVRITEVMANA